MRKGFFFFLSAFLLLFYGCNTGEDTGESQGTSEEDYSWGNALLLETDTGNAYEPQIDFDASGNAMAVWHQQGTVNNDIYCNHYASGAWQGGVIIDNLTASGTNAQVAYNYLGEALVVWYQYYNPDNSIFARHYNGAAWPSPELIEDQETGGASTPLVVMDDLGKGMSLFKILDGGYYNLWSSQFDGDDWEDEVILESENLGHVDHYSLAMSPSGEAMAVWRQYDGSYYNIWANYFSGTAWSGAENIENSNEYADYPHVVFDSQGNALVVWTQSDGTRDNVYCRIFNSNESTWGTVGEIDNSDETASYVRIACDPLGNAMAIWSQLNGPRYDMQACYYDGTSWGTPELIESNDTGNANQGQIAMDDRGKAMAVWRQHDGVQESIWACYYNGSSWEDDTLLEEDDTGAAIDPQIGFDPQGRAMAVWSQEVGGVSSIYYNRFD